MQGEQRRTGVRLRGRGRGNVRAQRIALGRERRFTLHDAGRVAVRARDPLLRHRRRRIGPGSPVLGIAPNAVVGREAGGEPVAAVAQLGGAGFPRREGRAFHVRCTIL